MKSNQATPAANLIAEHKLLSEDLDYLEEKVGSAGTVTPAALSERLHALRTRLAEHFGVEEQDGYAQTVLARAPQLDRKVRKALSEHAELMKSLEVLMQQVQASQSLNDSLRESLGAWIHRFRQHESQENLLIEDAFNVEVPAED